MKILWILSLLLGIILYKIIYVKYKIYKHKKNTSNAGSRYIPKVIYQLCPDKTNLHPKILTNIKKLKQLNPSYEYILMDDNDILEYMSQRSPELYRSYLKINPSFGAARADLFRYILLYDRGGIYLDLKSSASIPFDEMLKEDDEYIISHWPFPSHSASLPGLTNGRGEYCQWFLISKPQHKFLEATINLVCQNIETYNHEYWKSYIKDHNDSMGIVVLNITGPLAYTRAIDPIIHKFDNTKYNDFRTIGLEYSIFWNFFSLLFNMPIPLHRAFTYGTNKEISRCSHYSHTRGPLILNTYQKTEHKSTCAFVF